MPCLRSDIRKSRVTAAALLAFSRWAAEARSVFIIKVLPNELSQPGMAEAIKQTDAQIAGMFKHNFLDSLICEVRDCIHGASRFGEQVDIEGQPSCPQCGNISRHGLRGRANVCFNQRRHSKGVYLARLFPQALEMAWKRKHRKQRQIQAEVRAANCLHRT